MNNPITDKEARNIADSSERISCKDAEKAVKKATEGKLEDNVWDIRVSTGKVLH